MLFLMYDVVKTKLQVLNFGKNRKLVKLLKKIEDDQYFTFTICISIIAILIDFLIVKQFIEIIKLV